MEIINREEIESIRIGIEIYKNIIRNIAQPKINGKYINNLSDEELAELCVFDYKTTEINYLSPFVGKLYKTKNEAYQANLEWLKKEYKGENKK